MDSVPLATNSMSELRFNRQWVRDYYTPAVASGFHDKLIRDEWKEIYEKNLDGYSLARDLEKSFANAMNRNKGKKRFHSIDFKDFKSDDLHKIDSALGDGLVTWPGGMSMFWDLKVTEEDGFVWGCVQKNSFLNFKSVYLLTNKNLSEMLILPHETLRYFVAENMVGFKYDPDTMDYYIPSKSIDNVIYPYIENGYAGIIRQGD